MRFSGKIISLVAEEIGTKRQGPDKSGNFFGTAKLGGADNDGTAFAMETVEVNGTIRVSSGIMIPQNTARGTTFTITFTGKSGAIDEAATATVTAK